MRCLQLRKILNMKEKKNTEQSKSPLATFALAMTTIIATPPPPTSQALEVSSLPIVDIFVHLTSTSPTNPIMVLDSSSTMMSPLSLASLPPPLPTLSTIVSSMATTTMPPLTLPNAFAKYMQGVTTELSGLILNLIVQALMAQIIVGLPVPPPTIEPPRMETTMQISKEMEKRQR